MQNPYIGAVHLVMESAAAIQQFQTRSWPEQSKLRVLDLGRRASFTDFFTYTNEHLQNEVRELTPLRPIIRPAAASAL